MLGHRGCRLGITWPEIYEMQARAIFEAAANVTKRGVKVLPEVMVPLVAVYQEFTNQRTIIQRVADVEEVANLVAYIASPLSSATTGAALRVDGGVVDSMAI